MSQLWIKIEESANMGQKTQDSDDAVFNSAMRFITRRFHTEEELRRKLRIKHFREEDIEKALKNLAELGLVDDAKFAEIFLDNLIQYKSWGFYGLLSKLLSRGIGRQEAERLINKNLTLEKEEEIARRLLGKKDSIKLARSLASKGFRTEVIKKILSNLREIPPEVGDDEQSNS